ncbi:MAG: hypothetical protein JWM93_2804 [Frankiales bacterium]|nr:hypothetical protein [Frankiales bacterium]
MDELPGAVRGRAAMSRTPVRTSLRHYAGVAVLFTTLLGFAAMHGFTADHHIPSSPVAVTVDQHLDASSHDHEAGHTLAHLHGR